MSVLQFISPFFFPCGEGGMRLDASVSQQYLEDYLSYSENMLNKCQLHDMWQTKMACRRRNAGVASYDGLCLYKVQQ